jgi:sporulation protein YunB
MLHRHRPRHTKMTAIAAKKLHISFFLLILILIISLLVTGGMFLRSQITALAASQSQDVVISAINNIVKQTLSSGDYSYTDLVSLEKDNSGAVTAIVTDVTAINMLATEIMDNIVNETKEYDLKISIPLGNLTANSFLLDRGPRIPVYIIMVTSSYSGFRSDLTSAGINQTRHRIVLNLQVKISLLLPWRTVNTEVNSEVLVAETIIVGQVPESYLNWEN